MTHANPSQLDPESAWRHVPVDPALGAFPEGEGAAFDTAHEPGSRSTHLDEVTPASAAVASLVDFIESDNKGKGPAYTTAEIDAELAEKARAREERAAARATGRSLGVPLLRNMRGVGLPGLEREQADGPHAQGVFDAYPEAAEATAAAAQKAMADPVEAAQIRPTGGSSESVPGDGSLEEDAEVNDDVSDGIITPQLEASHQGSAHERTALSDYVVSMAVGRAMTAYYADLVKQFGAGDMHSVAVDMSTIYGFGMDARVGRAEDGAAIHKLETDPMLTTTVALEALSRMASGGTREARIQRLKQQLFQRLITIEDYKAGYEASGTDSENDQTLAREVLTQLTAAGSPGNRPMALDGQLSYGYDEGQQPQPSGGTEYVEGSRHRGRPKIRLSSDGPKHDASGPGNSREAGGPRTHAKHGKRTDAPAHA